jgi:hypothetical protein
MLIHGVINNWSAHLPLSSSPTLLSGSEVNGTFVSINAGTGQFVFDQTNPLFYIQFTIVIPSASGIVENHIVTWQSDEFNQPPPEYSEPLYLTLCACPEPCKGTPTLDDVADGDVSLTGTTNVTLSGQIVYAEKIDTVNGLVTAIGQATIQPNGTYRFEFSLPEKAVCGYKYQTYLSCGGEKIYSEKKLTKKTVCCNDCGCGGSGCGECGSSDTAPCLIEATKIVFDATAKDIVRLAEFQHNLALSTAETEFRIDRNDVWGTIEELNTKLKYGSSFQFRAKSNKGCIKTVVVPWFNMPTPTACIKPSIGTSLTLNVNVGDTIDTTVTINNSTKLVGIDSLPPGVVVIYEGITQSGVNLIVPIKGTVAAKGTYKPAAKAENACGGWMKVAAENYCMSIGTIEAVPLVCALPTITKKLTASMVVGEAFADTIIVSTATSATVNGLPSGLSTNVSENAGVLTISVTGKPTASGNYTLLIDAKNNCGDCKTPSTATGLDGGSGSIAAADVVASELPTKPVFLLTDPETGTMYALIKGVPNMPVWFGRTLPSGTFADFSVSPSFYDNDRWGGSFMGNTGAASAATDYEFKIGTGGTPFKYHRAFYKTYDAITIKGLGSITVGREFNTAGVQMSSATLVVTLTDQWAIGGVGYPFTVKVKQGGTSLFSHTQTMDANGATNSRPEMAEVVPSIANGNYTIEITMPDGTTRTESITLS